MDGGMDFFHPSLFTPARTPDTPPHYRHHPCRPPRDAAAGDGGAGRDAYGKPCGTGLAQGVGAARDARFWLCRGAARDDDGLGARTQGAPAQPGAHGHLHAGRGCAGGRRHTFLLHAQRARRAWHHGGGHSRSRGVRAHDQDRLFGLWALPVHGAAGAAGNEHCRPAAAHACAAPGHQHGRRGAVCAVSGRVRGGEGIRGGRAAGAGGAWCCACCLCRQTLSR
eukprot:359139-Chlamydomonas_euryale.AAC.20